MISLTVGSQPLLAGVARSRALAHGHQCLRARATAPGWQRAPGTESSPSRAALPRLSRDAALPPSVHTRYCTLMGSAELTSDSTSSCTSGWCPAQPCCCLRHSQAGMLPEPQRRLSSTLKLCSLMSIAELQESAIPIPAAASREQSSVLPFRLALLGLSCCWPSKAHSCMEVVMEKDCGCHSR